mmetsp:Transcript_22682/g.53633  ORF Transcript_22682/g.53633 Transcript_22682/m.53633 type:complete len:344 (+) Transcript_22682:87-1118(+)
MFQDFTNFSCCCMCWDAGAKGVGEFDWEREKERGCRIESERRKAGSRRRRQKFARMLLSRACFTPLARTLLSTRARFSLLSRASLSSLLASLSFSPLSPPLSRAFSFLSPLPLFPFSPRLQFSSLSHLLCCRTPSSSLSSLLLLSPLLSLSLLLLLSCFLALSCSHLLALSLSCSPLTLWLTALSLPQATRSPQQGFPLSSFPSPLRWRTPPLLSALLPLLSCRSFLFPSSPPLPFLHSAPPRSPSLLHCLALPSSSPPLRSPLLSSTTALFPALLHCSTLPSLLPSLPSSSHLLFPPSSHLLSSTAALFPLPSLRSPSLLPSLSPPFSSQLLFSPSPSLVLE